MMNLVHLKYAVEVEKTRSINKAAENLFMGQPNLSRAIKELEESLGIIIFFRTSKGIVPTPEGEEFLAHARAILQEVAKVENIYKNAKEETQTFSISVPRSSYISSAFVEFVKTLDHSRPMELYYKEVNAMLAINNIVQGNYNLGIVRYQPAFENHFSLMLKEKGLQFRELNVYDSLLCMSKNSPLAKKDSIVLNDLVDYVEIAHGDPYIPSMPMMEVKKAEFLEEVDKRIFVYERASQADLLNQLPNTYMWVSPTPKYFLDVFGLMFKKVDDGDKRYKDVLIFKKDYTLSELDKKFLEVLENVKKSCVES